MLNRMIVIAALAAGVVGIAPALAGKSDARVDLRGTTPPPSSGLADATSRASGAWSGAEPRLVKPRQGTSIGGPDLPGPIAKGGERDVAIEEGGATPPAVGQPDLAYGAYQRGFYLSAMKLALPRAEAGDPAAQTLLGELYMQGLGVARDPKQAASWYAFAAKSGDVQAQFSYASLLLDQARRAGRVASGRGLPGVAGGRDAMRDRSSDLGRAREYMTLAARSGHARANFNLAQMMVAERPSFAGFRRAVPHYRAAAEGGLPDAQYALATILAEGHGVPTPDHAAARTWMHRAALNGHDTAQVELAIWLANGKGGSADPKGALRWFERAAARGNVIAQNRLARIYAFGIGTHVDVVKAGAWHTITKRAGYVDPELDRTFARYKGIDKKRAIELANRWSKK